MVDLTTKKVGIKSSSPFNQWEWFKLSELFDIKKGKRLTKQNMLKGSTPFIGSSELENGVTAYINQNPIHKGNTISVTYNGSVAEAFYQPKDFWASDDVNVLYPKFKLEPYVALFISALIRKEKYRFNYGRKWHVERMVESKIKLPINNRKEIDLESIKKYMEDLYDIPNALQDLKKSKSSRKVDIKDTTWQLFKLSEIFTFERGKCGSAEKLLEKGNDISYVGAKKEDNGFMYTVVRDEKYVTKGNCIVFIGDGQGSVGYSTYQEKDFIGSTTLSMGRNSRLNKYNGLFIITLLDRERFKYSFGRKWNGDKLKNTKIKLPVNKEGEPDWQFMEDYIKSLPYSSSL